MTHCDCAGFPTGQATAATSVEIFLSCLSVDVEEEDVRVELVAQLPPHLAVQLPEIVRHHPGGQTDKQSEFTT